jgi:hypothetical protein
MITILKNVRVHNLLVIPQFKLRKINVCSHT